MEKNEMDILVMSDN